MSPHLWCIIMAGGMGSRFWPMSQIDNPKQFIDILGNGRSMLQTTFARFENICPRSNIIIVTGEAYTQRVHEQLPDLLPHQVLGEPLRRNTAPCIAYAAAVIHQLDPDAVVIVSPSDHAVFDDAAFERDMLLAVQAASSNNWIITVGVRPTTPNTSYGYIQFNEAPVNPSEPDYHKAITFTEKPPDDIARQFIASGEFLWNAGIFVWRLPVLFEAYRRHLPLVADAFLSITAQTTSAELESIYSQTESISVDFGIMEKADNVYVIRASFGWSDVETWESLYSTVRHDDNGNTFISGNVLTYDTQNTLVIMPDDPTKTVVLEGLDGYIVAANTDTLMICRRQNEEKVFKFASDVELNKMMGNEKK